MKTTVTVTSKNQITIPAKVARYLDIQPGTLLNITHDDDSIVLSKEQKKLDNLYQSVDVPRKYQGKDIDYIIQDAKSDYFKNRK